MSLRANAVRMLKGKVMKRLIACLVLILLAACSPAATGGIDRITAIPSVERTAQPTLQPTVTLAITPSATSALSALIAQAPSSTPRSENLPPGRAAEIAAATDTALQITPRSPVTFTESPVRMTFEEFYDGYDLRTGLVLSDKLTALDGEQVMMEGYMAPPLKPQLDYFVLTRIRLAFCPFCSNASDWPDDIALIYLPDETTNVTEFPVRITGRMEVGASVDQETGMVSLVRIYAERLEILN